MFKEKTYECACPVCHEATQVVSRFYSAGSSTYRKNGPKNMLYPVSFCKGKHTLKEVRDSLGMTVNPDENPDRVVGQGN